MLRTYLKITRVMGNAASQAKPICPDRPLALCGEHTAGPDVFARQVGEVPEQVFFEPDAK